MKMMQRIYADTSVIGGCLDEEFRFASRRIFDWFKKGKAVIVVSELTLIELENGPEQLAAILDQVPERFREYVELTREADELAWSYIRQGVIGVKNRVDAQHIAIATLSRVDVLVSWNFKHIVNLPRIRGYNSINLRQGLPTLEIRTPQEAAPDEKD
jgi:hypothetical protein